MIDINSLSKRELARQYHKSDDKELKSKISLKILELDKQEHKDSKILIEVGKKYKARNGNTILITGRFLAIYQGKNLSKQRSDNKKVKYPNYYLDGTTNKKKETNLDIIKEINNGN